MSKYSCDICSFKTGNKTDYSRHSRTKKHKEKVKETTKNTIGTQDTYIKTENIHKCPFCNNVYSNSSSLARHKKACGVKQEIIKEKEKDDMINNNELNTLKKENERLQKQNEIYEKQLETFTELLKTKMNPTNVNNLTYIINNYDSAPQLKKLESYKQIHNAKTVSLVDLIILYYEQNTLCKFIGDFLIGSYLKKNDDDQSMWNTDTSRLTYIVNELQESGKIKWVMDKKGIKVKEYVIMPLLEYLLDELTKYVDKNSKKSETGIVNKLSTITNIYPLIKKEILADDIVRYIAPYFYLHKENNKLKQIEIPTKNNINEQSIQRVNKTKQLETPKNLKPNEIIQIESSTQIKTSTPNKTKQPTKAPKKEMDEYSEIDSDESVSDFIKELRIHKAEVKANQLKTSQDNPNLVID